MPSKILINVRPHQTRVAYLENDELTDFLVEKRQSPTMVGSIYKGIVSRVLPGMQAAFVDIGLDKAAFLYVGDVVSKSFDQEKDFEPFAEHIVDSQEQPLVLGEEEDDNTPKEDPKVFIQDLLEEGQSLLCQVMKDPLGTKGARITTHISLPGRHIVLMPLIQHLGVSKKIFDLDERARLKDMVARASPKGGVIVRTAGEGMSEKQFQGDLDYLNRLWKDIDRSYSKRKTKGPVHKEPGLALRSLRDFLNENVSKVLVDNEATLKKIQSFVSQFMPAYKQSLELYKKDLPLFDAYGVDLEVSRSLKRKIWLKSGGYLVFDEAEALVAIDVNTGRYVGKKDIEDTIIKTNLEAAVEVAHQLRIRNCGGIIIIDFIDMEKEAHKEQLMQILSEELEKDRAKTTVLSLSQFGLAEMTRKRIRPSLVSQLCEPCYYCEGTGYIKRTSTVAHEVFRAIEREVRLLGKGFNVVVQCHAKVADWVYDEESETLDELEKRMACNVTFKVDHRFHIEQFEVIANK